MHSLVTFILLLGVIGWWIEAIITTKSIIVSIVVFAVFGEIFAILIGGQLDILLKENYIKTWIVITVFSLLPYCLLVCHSITSRKKLQQKAEQDAAANL